MAKGSATHDLTLRLGDLFLDAAGQAGIPASCLLNGGLDGKFQDGLRAFLAGWYGTSYPIRRDSSRAPAAWHRLYEPVLPTGPKLVLHPPAGVTHASAFHVFPVTHPMTQEEGRREIASRILHPPTAEDVLQAAADHAQVRGIRQLVLFGLELDPAPQDPYTVWMGGRDGRMYLSHMPITTVLRPGMHIAGIR